MPGNEPWKLLSSPPQPPKRPCVHQEDELFVTGRFPEIIGAGSGEVATEKNRQRVGSPNELV